MMGMREGGEQGELYIFDGWLSAWFDVMGLQSCFDTRAEVHDGCWRTWAVKLPSFITIIASVCWEN